MSFKSHLAIQDFSKHFVVKHEKTKWRDLFQILFYRDLEHKNFIEHSKPKIYSFAYRWIIFISLIAQKLLQLFSKPLAVFGSLLEMWLNLLSNNRNFSTFVLRFVTGKAVIPDKSSATYLSFIGLLDTRQDLDSSIDYEDPKEYFASLSMMAAKVSYENEAYIQTTVTDSWKMEFLGAFNFWNDYTQKAKTGAFMFHDKKDGHNTIVVAFRGTQPFDADQWCTDLDISWYKMENVGKVHSGFMKALGLQKSTGWPKNPNPVDEKRDAPLAYYHIRDMLKTLLMNNNGAKFIVCGHSLGGALAILFPAILVFNKVDEGFLLDRMEGVYTFGQPRIGDSKFGVFMEKKLKEYKIEYFRFVYGNDMVPRLPPDDKELMFKHFGTCVQYDFLYRGKVVKREPNKNYFALWAVIPMNINAVFELIRSFTIPFIRGRDYKENKISIFGRIFGLIVPGVSAHGPRDYVNSTRLGSSRVFLPHGEKNE